MRWLTPVTPALWEAERAGCAQYRQPFDGRQAACEPAGGCADGGFAGVGLRHRRPDDTRAVRDSRIHRVWRGGDGVVFVPADAQTRARRLKKGGAECRRKKRPHCPACTVRCGRLWPCWPHPACCL